VDSSFSALRGFLGGDIHPTIPAITTVVDSSNISPRQGFGLLRRASGFSIASVAASLPGGLGRDLRSRAGSIATTLATADENGQQMIEVPSRPGSVKSSHPEETSSGAESETEESSAEGSGSEEEEDEEEADQRSDVRSIRSFGSMMSGAKEGRPRKSLSDRLANVSARLAVSGSPSRDSPLRKLSPPQSRRTSLLLSSPKNLPIVLTEEIPSAPAIPPPNRRFLDCQPDDLKVGEIPLLLKEYRRMVEALQERGAFQDVKP